MAAWHAYSGSFPIIEVFQSPGVHACAKNSTCSFKISLEHSSVDTWAMSVAVTLLVAQKHESQPIEVIVFLAHGCGIEHLTG